MPRFALRVNEQPIPECRGEPRGGGFPFRPRKPYTGRAFRDVCLGNGIVPSVGQTGICFDNAAAESWNATFKKELIHLHAWKNVEHVWQASFEFAEVYYNRQRIFRRDWGI